MVDGGCQIADVGLRTVGWWMVDVGSMKKKIELGVTYSKSQFRRINFNYLII
jgi:hypothetical protein